eukprot:c9429_g1_i2.p1 GENE.c9429_g1_i2~~c9429_g1_i2.p1  ORF type:complete len:209 (+),score=57.54 c9429_g1_i2:55-681(+)
MSENDSTSPEEGHVSAVEQEPEVPEVQEHAEERFIDEEAATRLKAEGNTLFGEKNYEQAIGAYTQAIDVCPNNSVRAQCYGNRAACYVALDQYEPAISDCTSALEIDPTYTKVLARRMGAYETLDKIEDALTDAKKVVELDPGHKAAIATVAKLEPIVRERQEREKEEMMNKLKDLGNSFLGKFGLSLNNFKTQRDPGTGSYNISFQQ